MSVTQSCTKFVRETRLCSSRKYPYPTVEGIGSSGGEGGGGQRRKKNYRVCMGEIWKFRGVGVYLQIPSLVGYGYFLELHIHMTLIAVTINL